MRTVVTGGSGYLGWNLLREMDRRGLEYQNVDIKEGLDILDLPKMRVLCEGTEVIYHLAAMPDVQESIRDPVRTNKVNVEGTLNMLECARENGSTFVFISSFAAKDIQSPYGLHKRIGEEYCRLFSNLYGIRCFSLRLSNLYGGTNYVQNKESVIAVFTKQLSGGGPLTVFGGDQIRDFVHVDDVVAGIIGVTGSQKKMEIYEISSGVETSIKDLAELFRKYDPNLEVQYLDYLKGEVMRSIGDPSLAGEDFGYRPTKTLSEGIRDLIDAIGNIS